MARARSCQSHRYYVAAVRPFCPLHVQARALPGGCVSVIRGGKKTPPIIRSCDADGGGDCALWIYTWYRCSFFWRAGHTSKTRLHRGGEGQYEISYALFWVTVRTYCVWDPSPWTSESNLGTTCKHLGAEVTIGCHVAYPTSQVT